LFGATRATPRVDEQHELIIKGAASPTANVLADDVTPNQLRAAPIRNHRTAYAMSATLWLT
jgi:hypothetical protein